MAAEGSRVRRKTDAAPQAASAVAPAVLRDASFETHRCATFLTMASS
jgi:hypothetical protein